MRLLPSITYLVGEGTGPILALCFSHYPSYDSVIQPVGCLSKVRRASQAMPYDLGVRTSQTTKFTFLVLTCLCSI